MIYHHLSSFPYYLPHAHPIQIPHPCAYVLKWVNTYLNFIQNVVFLWRVFSACNSCEVLEDQIRRGAKGGPAICWHNIKCNNELNITSYYPIWWSVWQTGGHLVLIWTFYNVHKSQWSHLSDGYLMKIYWIIFYVLFNGIIWWNVRCGEANWSIFTADILRWKSGFPAQKTK